MLKNRFLFNVLLLFIVSITALGQTTTYKESFTTTSLTSTYITSTFTTNLGTWSSSGGGCGLSTTGINTNTLKLKTGVNSAAISPILHGVSTISYSAKTVGASANLTVTDGNATFSSTIAIGTSTTSSGTIVVPNNSNGIFTFSYPNTTSVTSEYIDDMIFTFKKPVSQAISFTSTSPSNTSMTLGWTRPNNGNDNQGCIVFVGPSNAAFVPPTNGTSYAANAIYGSGTQIGISGYYCVYNGTGSTASITGLTSGTNYSVYVLEYNGIKGQSDENYNTVNPATNSSSSIITVYTNTNPFNDFSANVSTPSLPQSLSFSGNSLSSALLITAPADFEISTNANSGYTNTLSFNPISGSIATTLVYVRLKSGLVAAPYSESIVLSSTGAISQNVICNGDVFANAPIVLAPSVAQLNGFNYAFGGVQSVEQAFTVNGSNLLDNLVITAPTDFEISFNATSGYVSGSTTLLIPPTNGEVSAAVVYVRLKSGLSTNNYSSESVTIASLSGITQSVVCNGSVTATSIVTQQPTDVTICNGSNTTFTAASTTSTLLNWQRSKDGISWENITSSLDSGVTYSGFTTTVLTLTNCTSTVNFYKYRAVFTNATSTSATLTVAASNSSLIINGPSNLCIGTTGTFTAIDSSNPNPGTINPDNFLTPIFSSVTVTSNVAYGPTNSDFHLVDVYRPTGDTNTNRPAVMFFHGGGFRVGNTKTQSYVVAICTYLAKCGYVAFAPNYNVGGGHTYAQNLAAVKDADLCLNWIRANGATYGYNPNYLFEGGGSAGAHLSCNFMFSDNSPNYGGYVVNLSNVIAFADCWGSSPDADRLYNYSSLNSKSMPCYIVQGDADTTVPVQESITLNNYLTAARAKVQFWEIPGETHGCPNHIPQISDQIARFFNSAWHNYTSSTTSTGVSGGVWSSSNPSVANINATTGAVTPIAAGTTTITYTLSTSSSCSTVRTVGLTVSASAVNTTTIAACNSYTWNGTTYTTSGLYTGNTTNCVTEKLALTISPSAIAGTVTGGGVICSTGGSGTLNVTGSVGTIQWQYSLDGGLTYVNAPIASTVSPTLGFSTTSTSNATSSYIVTAIKVPVKFRVNVISGSCPIAYSNVVDFILASSPTPGIITSSIASPICSGTGTTLSLSGNIGTVQWQKSTTWTATTPTWTNIVGTTTYATGNLTASNAYRALVTLGTCGSLPTNVIVIAISPAPVAKSINVSTSTPSGVTSLLPICTNSTIPKILTIGSGYIGNIQWQTSTDGKTYTDIVGQNTISYTVNNPIAGVNYFRAKFSNGCTAVYNTAVKVYYTTCLVKMATDNGSVSKPTFKVLAYPNPYSDNFKLDVETSSEETIEFSVYDMLGKLIETREIKQSDYSTKEFGLSYSAGVYNLIVKQNKEIKILKIVKI